ncbi:hypothetical protein KJ657_05520 [Patescibacteria group bacterium]|nr:hypothetical protein [Patescibacteria group bacterium]MBU1016516.1 hypothetical protein [Patescibacteria group bacterium]MBU1685105.1 hypothetical protein [Patescibacteria group bacterium]MBU1938605.1 hypothetical protein [Patescibacteria group bacterium]
MPNCKQCSTGFEILKEDRALLSKLNMPDPTMCFTCRLKWRLAFYNRRKLYRRKCDLTGENIVSVISPDKPFKVYNVSDWFSDKWDPMEYGRDFDFNRPFFEQINELIQAVPHIALSLMGDNINSDFTNDNYKLKNCYLVFDGERAEDTYYGETFFDLRNCMEFLFLYQSELCYECTGCNNCFNLKYSSFCTSSSDSWFLRDCIGCKNCFGCANLHQKEYHIFNKPHTKEEYEKFMADFQSGHYGAIQEMKKKVREFHLTQPVKATRGVQNVDSHGDNLSNSQNSYYCFDSNDLKDCRYCTNCLLASFDSMDVHVWGDKMERCYNCSAVGAGATNVFMSSYCGVGVSDIYYSYWCTRNCTNCFGSAGLKHKKYCVLNKQYSKEEYEKLVPRIIEHMKKTGEWGEFFPPNISPFGYNETLAQDHFPLKKAEAFEQGYKWSDFEPELQAVKTIPAERLPDDIKDVPDDILNWAIVGEVTEKPYKIVAQELKFYREQNLPIPHRHPDQRHWDRIKIKNPYMIWNRNCAKCQKDIETSYSPDRPEVVYCEQCYLKEVY